MTLQPKKNQRMSRRKGVLTGLEFKAIVVSFGTIGLKAAQSGLVSAKVIEAARKAIMRKIKKQGKLWIRIFPDYPVTSKPTESRMGKGKGGISHWAAKIKAGTTLFEIGGAPLKTAVEALTSAGHKLPVKTKIFF